MQSVAHRVADTRMLRLIRKGQKAGVSEELRQTPFNSAQFEDQRSRFSTWRYFV